MARKTDRPPLSEAQLEILHVVWQYDEITVSDVWQQIAAKRPVARNTILTVMDRLEKRGWLSKRSVGKTDLYQAVVSKKKTLSEMARQFVDSVFGGSADSLVMTLLEGRGVTTEEIQRIRQHIDEAKTKSQ